MLLTCGHEPPVRADGEAGDGRGWLKLENVQGPVTQGVAELTTPGIQIWSSDIAYVHSAFCLAFGVHLPDPETTLALPHEVLVLLHEVHLGDGDVKLPLDVEAADHQLAGHAPHHQQPRGPTQLHCLDSKPEISD